MTFLLAFLIGFYSQTVTLTSDNPLVTEEYLYENWIRMKGIDFLNGIPEDLYTIKIDNGATLIGFYREIFPPWRFNNAIITTPGTIKVTGWMHSGNSLALDSAGDLWFYFERKGTASIGTINIGDGMISNFAFRSKGVDVSFWYGGNRDLSWSRGSLSYSYQRVKISGWNERILESDSVNSSGLNLSYTMKCCKSNVFLFNVSSVSYDSPTTNVPHQSVDLSFKNSFSWKNFSMNFYISYSRYFTEASKFRWSFNTGVVSTLNLDFLSIKLSSYLLSGYDRLTTIPYRDPDRGVGGSASLSSKWKWIIFRTTNYFFYKFYPDRDRSMGSWLGAGVEYHNMSLLPVYYIAKSSLPRFDPGGGKVDSRGWGVIARFRTSLGTLEGSYWFDSRSVEGEKNSLFVKMITGIDKVDLLFSYVHDKEDKVVIQGRMKF